MNKKRCKVLVAPLDWGLGHATRSIPVIRAFLKQGNEVVICASGNGKIILLKEFPGCTFVEIPGIAIRYPEKGSMAISVLMQLPAMLKAIRNEHRLLEQIIIEHKITHVISDNRYGLYSSRAKSAFITHQVNIQSSPKLKFLEPFINRLNKFFIEKFDELWIPDIPLPNNFSGNLSDEKKISIPVHHIGVQSRFTKQAKPAEKTYDFIALLSGPEPQRTIVENKIKKHFAVIDKKCLIVQGLPGENVIDKNTSVHVVSSITDQELQQLLHPGTILICRPGYSTIMDLIVLGHSRIVFIPTPGQTEQEYLAEYYFHTYGIRYIPQGEHFPHEYPDEAITFPENYLIGEPEKTFSCFVKD